MHVNPGEDSLAMGSSWHMLAHGTWATAKNGELDGMVDHHGLPVFIGFHRRVS